MDSATIGRASKALVYAVGMFAIGAFVRFVYRGYKVRMRIQSLRAQGIPTLPHSLIFGHILILLKFHKEYPGDVHFGIILSWLVDNCKKWIPDLDDTPPVLYLDIWPIFPDIMMMVLDCNLSAQFTQIRSLPKHPITRTFLEPLTDNLDMTSADGAQSKVWRSRFNPSFSPRNITRVIPELIDEILVFKELLGELAGSEESWGEVFQMEELTTNLTFDVILRATLDERLHEQTNPGGSPLKRALIIQIQLMSKVIGINRILGIKRWPWEMWSRHRNNQALRYALLGRVEAVIKSGLVAEPITEKQNILNIALARTLKETGGRAPDQQSVDAILANLKLFLFAGHDTTSSTICWMLKLLQDNPDCLSQLRAEHDRILGADPKQAARLLRESPQLLNSLPYTNGVVKETLRFYPLASTVRQGERDFFLHAPGTGTRYPTEGMAIHDVPSVIQLDPRVWPRATEFLPERWLAGPGNPMHPNKDAWRPFSMGPRNCIGMELAMVEIKLVAALVCREFDVGEAWEEWDSKRSVKGQGNTVDGERLYGCGQTVQHPKDGMPVHVRRR
ncbi:Uu.00g073910.m01.CDS01 [Anthostomella pinea]|uniref:Uu.00g073910.m01.CDS01 n=1 Tax=Anthostomella pinea TaxID=933095 RepID=A0AAI8YP42_9PEZI|nr:Uu.00g073910.m01.CDS01 [Anthostomella pinea]